jgi:acylphosphatase
VPGRRFLVLGQVQGVGFRYFAVRSAERAGVTGWVRNLPDGTVEVHAWGTPGALEELAGFLGKGPRFSHVTNVENIEISPEVPSPISFSIRV